MLITDQTNLDELKAIPRLYQTYDWFQNIQSRLGRRPNRKEIDPIDLSFALGYEMITEFHREKVDARFRLIGSIVEEFTGLGRSSKGRWYSEVFDAQSLTKVMTGVSGIMDQNFPFFGFADYTRTDGTAIEYARIIFPLETLDDEPEMLFTVFSAIVEDDDKLASRDKISSTLR